MMKASPVRARENALRIAGTDRMPRASRPDPDFFDAVRRAFAEFLTVPTLIILGFVLLAAVSLGLERADLPLLQPARRTLASTVFSSARATSDLLSTIAAGLITVTSITISLLLVALQQSAGSMTSQVFDQFLRRQINQVYFGVFVGLAMYALVTLASVRDDFTPVYGATLAVLFTLVALYLLIVLLYTTINEMRPVEIIEAIHDLTLAARGRQLAFIQKTRHTSRGPAPVHVLVRANRAGYVTRVDLETIAEAGRGAGGTEVVLLVSIGTFVAFEDPVARIHASSTDGAVTMHDVVRDAVHLELQRDIALDPAYGIEQIETIAWTSISTAQSNPDPGVLGIRSLRDLMARWSSESRVAEDPDALPIVYRDDTLLQLMNAFETLAVVASESMQHQSLAEILRAFAALVHRLPPEQQARAEDVIRRVISTLGDHVLTAELDRALVALVAALADSGRHGTAAAVQTARDTLAATVGTLNSRASRVRGAD
jgi:uncharacterized membrane protein